MSSRLARRFAVLAVSWLLVGPIWAADPSLPSIGPSQTWEQDFGLEIVNEHALTDEQVAQLRGILNAIPRALYPALRVISVDQPSTIGALTQERCPAVDGRLVFCAINIESAVGVPDQPLFPSDTPGGQLFVSRFYQVAVHELSHQIDLGANEQRGFLAWSQALIAEAGCPIDHYLSPRLGAGPCFFVTFPQEFVANIGHQWLSDSRRVLSLGLARFAGGNPHPLNQVLLIGAIFSMRPFSLAGEPGEDVAGTVFAFRHRDGIPVQETWRVFPWRCGGAVTVAGSGFSVGLDLDSACRVVEIHHAEGL